MTARKTLTNRLGVVVSQEAKKMAKAQIDADMEAYGRWLEKHFGSAEPLAPAERSGLKFANLETGTIIQGEAPGKDFACGGRSNIIHFCCVNCDNWSVYDVREAWECPDCGQDPMLTLRTLYALGLCGE